MRLPFAPSRKSILIVTASILVISTAAVMAVSNFSQFDSQTTRTNQPSEKPSPSPTMQATDGVTLSEVASASASVPGSATTSRSIPSKSTPIQAAQKTNASSSFAGQPAQSPYPILSPNVVTLGDSSTPYLRMSTKLEISSPPSDFSSPDLSISWYEDGTGHYAPGPYYLGWKALIVRKNTSRDGEAIFKVTTQDRAGNSYSTTLKVIYFAERHLRLEAGALSKHIDGDTVTYTGRVTFKPSSNIGNPSVRLTSIGFYNFDYTPCSLNRTNVTFTYTGQATSDVTCALPLSSLSNYPGGFDILVNADVKWPGQPAISYTTKFRTY